MLGIHVHGILGQFSSTRPISASAYRGIRADKVGRLKEAVAHVASLARLQGPASTDWGEQYNAIKVFFVDETPPIFSVGGRMGVFRN